jgi:hypothetical protein
MPVLAKFVKKFWESSGRMNQRVVVIALAIILALAPCLSALAVDNSTVTITMLTDKYVEITLEPAEWNIGDVEPNGPYVTSPTWCTMTNEGNCVVNIYIKGEDASWVGGSGYEWTLSSDNTTAVKKYALWYHIAYDSADSYTSITKIDTQMRKTNGAAIQLIGNGDQKQFGLKLVTPLADTSTGHFYGDRQMETHIAISAVIA